MKLQVIFNLAGFIKADPVELHLHYSSALLKLLKITKVLA